MTKMTQAMQRSVDLYLDPARAPKIDAFYRAFVAPNDLVFDIGAHVGDRTACFRRLGARVVALEPQPELAAFLRAQHGADAQVSVIEAAAGAQQGVADMRINERNPTVSTLSEDFIASAAQAAGWEGQEWSGSARVSVVTLDELVRRFGSPHFVKIDVEGYELDCLHGLTIAPPRLSFEFTTIQRGVALACIDHLERIAPRLYRASLGESFAFAQDASMSAQDMAHWLRALPMEVNSGDIYASPA